MPDETLILKLDDEVDSELNANLIGLDVDLDDEMASMARLRIRMNPGQGEWTYSDDDRFRPFTKFSVDAGFEEPELLFSGYVTHVRPQFNEVDENSVLEVWAMDGSVLMDREEKIKDWPDKKDSDIATELFSAYGLAPEVDDTSVIHDQAVSTILQRETDIQFLRRLAIKNGYECYVEGDTGYFRVPQIDAEPQPLLRKDGQILRYISFDVNGLTPANVAIAQMDRVNKEVLEASAENSDQTALGAEDLSAMLPMGVNPAQIFVRQSVATGQSEMSALCQGLYHRGEWFVFGEGLVAAKQYAHVLKPRLPVTITAVGELYSGIYMVSHVTHSFTLDNYVQYFRVRRNGLGLTGDEDFSGSDGLSFL